MLDVVLQKLKLEVICIIDAFSDQCSLGDHPEEALQPWPGDLFQGTKTSSFFQGGFSASVKWNWKWKMICGNVKMSTFYSFFSVVYIFFQLSNRTVHPWKFHSFLLVLWCNMWPEVPPFQYALNHDLHPETLLLKTWLFTVSQDQHGVNYTINCPGSTYSIIRSICNLLISFLNCLELCVCTVVKKPLKPEKQESSVLLFAQTFNEKTFLCTCWWHFEAVWLTWVWPAQVISTQILSVRWALQRHGSEASAARDQ